MRIYKSLLCILALFASCNRIETGDSLKSTDLARIKQLGLLDEGEKIYRFYSEYRNDVAGNFYTDKRVAMYWIDEKNQSKNQVSFSFYQDIKTIDTVYNAGASYCPYMLVTKLDNSKFKVCVDGKRQEIKDFFEDVLSKWKQQKKVN